MKAGRGNGFLAVGASLCAVAVVVYYLGGHAGGKSPAPPPSPGSNALTAPIASPSPSPEQRESRPVPKMPMSAPTRLVIPGLDIDTELTTVGRTRDGNIGAPDPDTPHIAAWYRLSVTPGEPGSSVIVGHVDTKRGPAVFYRLSTLGPKDTVEVVRADGSTAVFSVDAIRVYPKAEFPSREVLAPRGRAELRLITCGGDFDPDSGYRDNIIVYAHLVDGA